MNETKKSIEEVLRNSLPSATNQQIESGRQRVLDRVRTSVTTGLDSAEQLVRLDARSNLGWRWVAVFAVIAMAAIGIWMAVPAPGLPVFATLDETPGAVLYRMVNGVEVVMDLGTRIEVGELVRTKGTRGLVTLADGSRVEMRSNSELALERADDGARIHLVSGSVIVNAAQQRTGRLYVETKDVMVSVVGTVFLVNAEEAGSRVAVIEGEVQVQYKDTVNKLRPGDQVATDTSMEAVPVAKEISWSPSAPAHLAMLQQNTAIKPASPQRLKFAADSVRPAPPRYFTADEFYGFACRGIDGTKAAEFGNGADPAVHTPQGRCVGNVTQMRYLIRYAYGLSAYQLRFSPDASEVGSQVYDIQAIADDPRSATIEQLRMMLQTMLEDRFKLESHRESPEVPGYALVLSKTAHNLKEAPGPEVGPRMFYNENRQMVVKGTTTLDTLAQWLANTGNGGIGLAPVVNRTGLTGIYDYEFVRTGGGSGGRGGGNSRNPPNPGLGPEEYARYVAQVRGQNYIAEDRAEAISDAMQDQLGLKLQAEKLTADVMVIDKLEKLSPN